MGETKTQVTHVHAELERPTMEDARSTSQKRRRYTVAEKLQIMADARTRTVAAASISSGASRSSIHEWLKQEAVIAQYHPGTKRCARGGVDEYSPSTSPQQDTTHENEDGTLSPSPCPMHNALPACAVMPSATSNEQQSNSEARQLDTSVLDTSMSPATSLHTTRATTDATRARQADGLSYVTPRRASDTVLVGINGGDGDFTSAAARKAFDDVASARHLPTSTYKLASYAQIVHTMNALHQGEVDFAVIATDMLWSAAFHAAFDRVVSHRLVVVGEIVSAEQTCASALPGTELADVDCVISDWRLLAKHEDYILQLEEQIHRTIVRQVTWGSSVACRIVREEQAPNTLVLCRQEAATSNGLTILQERVSSDCVRTKYTVLARRGAAPLQFEALEGRERTSVRGQQCSLMIQTAQEAGLARIVSVLARHDVQIERFLICNKGDEPNRYCARTAWQQMGPDEILIRCVCRPGQTFAVSFRSNLDSGTEREVWRELSALAERVIYLGNYPTHTI